MPDAVMLVLDLPAAALTDSLAAAVRGRGLDVGQVAPREGYVESAWYDVDTHTTVPAPFRRLDRVAKLRFFADPVSGHTRLFAECVVRIAWDPSVPERDLERMAPPDHAARALLDSMLTPIRAFVVRDTTKAGGPPLPEGVRRDTSRAGGRLRRP